MILKKQQNLLHTWTKIILYSYATPKSIRASGYRWLDPVKFSLDKYDDNNSRIIIMF